jgi:hypothetical protein
MCPDSLVIPNRDIWENGVPLFEADYHFADENLRAKYIEPQIPLPFRLLAKIATLIAQPENEKEKLEHEKIEQINRDALDQTNSYLSAVLEARELLLSDLRKGKLISYGYVAPRNPASIRSKIPRDLYEPKYVIWEDSSVKGAGIEFSAVLVFELELAQEIDAQLAKKPLSQGTGIKRGPPPSSGAIEEAIRSLLDEGWQSQNYLQKENIVTIRAHVHKLHPGKFPNDRDLSKESIRVVLAKLIPRTIK